MLRPARRSVIQRSARFADPRSPFLRCRVTPHVLRRIECYNQVRTEFSFLKIFIDDSGGFGWAPPGISLFCALTVSDKTVDELSRAFATWKLRQPRSAAENELKGKDLSRLQQVSFASSVLLANKGLMLTLAGTDTRSFERSIAKEYLRNAAAILRASAKKAAELGKTEIADSYVRMSRWATKRSPENVLWLLTLVEAIDLSIQHSIIMFADEMDAHEFESIEIIIDESFIKKEAHAEFWKEWLRLRSFKKVWETPREWSSDHPFNRKYRESSGLLNTRDLFRNHMRFANSDEVIGIQIADICANICYRRWSGKPKYQPYRLLRSRVRGKYGSEIHIGNLDRSSLLADEPEKHVTFYSEDDMARWAGEARTARPD